MIRFMCVRISPAGVLSLLSPQVCKYLSIFELNFLLNILVSKYGNN